MGMSHLLFDESLIDPEGWVIEIGSGSKSTPWFQRRFKKFESIDPVSKFATVSALAEEFLTSWDKPISAMYFDGYDWIWEHMRAANPGWEKENVSSQVSHRRSLDCVEPFLTEDAVIVFDDTYPVQENSEEHPGTGGWSGKGGRCIDTLVTFIGATVVDSVPNRLPMSDPAYMKQKAYVKVVVD